MDLCLIRLIRHGERCIVEETKNGWFLPYSFVPARGHNLHTLVTSSISSSLKEYLNGYMGVKLNEDLQVRSVVANIVITDEDFAKEIESTTAKWISLSNLKKSLQIHSTKLDQEHHVLLGPDPIIYLQNSINTVILPLDLFNPTSRIIHEPKKIIEPDSTITNILKCDPIENLKFLETGGKPSQGCAVFPKKDIQKLTEIIQNETGPSSFINLKSFIAIFKIILPQLFLDQGSASSMINLLFRSFIQRGIPFLSTAEFMCGLYACHPEVNHGGKAGRIRTCMIFKYYSEKERMTFDEFRFFYLSTKHQQANPGSFPTKEAIYMTEVDENDFNDTCFVFKMKDQMMGPSETDFTEAIGRLKFRGTSLLLRLPNIKLDFFESNSPRFRPGVKRKRLDQTNGFGLSPAKSEVSLASISDTDESSVDNRFASLKCGFMDSKKQYKLATHSVSLRKSGIITTVADIKQMWDLPGYESDPGAGSGKIDRLMSIRSFDKKSFANEMIEGLRYFGREQKKENQMIKPAYNWGTTNTDSIASCILSLCEEVKIILSREPRLLEISAPCYIMGDLHGNYEDLSAFEKLLWRTGMILSPAKFLFLGDYVDRGEYGLEVVAHLFAQKVLAPNKIFLIRGNHEHRDIQEHFTFLRECISRFGEHKGNNIWNEINNVFDAMPLAAVVDGHIFCTHGGIPEERKYDQVGFKQAVNNIPVPLTDPELQSPLAWDLMWADPARETDINDENQEHYFLENTRRKTSCLFTAKALKAFIQNTGYQYVIRAHECQQVGFKIQHGCLLTVFSSSEYCGGTNEAACILVDDDKIRTIRLDTKHHHKITNADIQFSVWSSNQAMEE